MSNLIDAQYVSIWDGGSTEVWTDVIIDLEEMIIVKWKDDTKRYEGCEVSDDGELKVLDEEKVITTAGVEFTCMTSEYYNINVCPNDDDYDVYGNGIIVYDL